MREKDIDNNKNYFNGKNLSFSFLAKLKKWNKLYLVYNLNYKNMSVFKEWEEYYTLEEVDIMLDKSIKKSADELILELRERKRDREKINNKEVSYV